MLLLLAPLVMILPVPLYNRASPELLGIPFFYWYQLAWLLVLSACLVMASRCGGEPS
ncbi:hypothetical protein ASAC_1454 [Acidilobus saccharovorans 345-15]|uniref:DUF3311 domain-containing protein n=1 Tax=Acidilobus saccharovorans (strain DSM 16705 / JCM 18335 / VKM B-2471 / 345-15) TaxID=666510 RepID=D9PZ72_ACIS3|nr:hypothetical protein ASAC_1454 [Acidilobus saccharovorans 345-15]